MTSDNFRAIALALPGAVESEHMARRQGGAKNGFDEAGKATRAASETSASGLTHAENGPITYPAAINLPRGKSKLTRPVMNCRGVKAVVTFNHQFCLELILPCIGGISAPCRQEFRPCTGSR